MQNLFLTQKAKKVQQRLSGLKMHDNQRTFDETNKTNAKLCQTSE